MCRVQTRRVLRPIDTYRNLARGRAQFLVQPAVRTYPHVVLGDFHLRWDTRFRQRETDRLG